MTREKLIKHVKMGTRLRLDRVQINAKAGPLSGKGMARCSKGSFRFRITLDEGQEPPVLKSGIIGRDDFCEMEGVIEDSLKFKAIVPPFGRWSISGDVRQIRLSASSIELGAQGTDSMTIEEIRKLFDTLDGGEELPAHEAAQDTTPSSHPTSVVECDCYFTGLLKAFQLIDHNVDGKHFLTDKDLIRKVENAKAAFSGQLADSFEFALLEVSEGLEFHLQSKTGYKSSGEAEDLEHFSAFQTAIGFVFGRHPWPFILQYRRDGRLVLDQIRPPERPTSMTYAPFTDRHFYDSRVHKNGWSLREPLARAYQYFDQRTPESRTISNFLFHFREAAKKKVHARVSAMALCPMLENLIQLIATSEKLRVKDSDFAKVRAKVTAVIEKERDLGENIELRSLFDRFIGRCASMDQWDAAQLFRAVIAKLGMPWEPRWQAIFTLWKSHRNSALHVGRNQPKEDYREDLIVSSQVAGAINVILLKMMGYSGEVRWSAFGDDYGRM